MLPRESIEPIESVCRGIRQLWWFRIRSTVSSNILARLVFRVAPNRRGSGRRASVEAHYLLRRIELAAVVDDYSIEPTKF